MQGRGEYTQGQYYADGSPIGNPAQSDWLKDVPWGFRKLLSWVKNRCGECCKSTCLLTTMAQPPIGMVSFLLLLSLKACCTRGC